MRQDMGAPPPVSALARAKYGGAGPMIRSCSDGSVSSESRRRRFWQRKEVRRMKKITVRNAGAIRLTSPTGYNLVGASC